MRGLLIKKLALTNPASLNSRNLFIVARCSLQEGFATCSVFVSYADVVNYEPAINGWSNRPKC